MHLEFTTSTATDARESTFTAVYRDQFNITNDFSNAVPIPPPLYGILRYAHGASWDPDLCCSEDTRKDLLQEVMTWVATAENSQHAEIFCLADVAGSGKTAIAHTICRLCDAEHILGSSFFLNQESAARSSSDRLLINLISDLARINDDVGKYILKVLEGERDLLGASQSRRFERLIVEPFHRHPVARPIVIVIDAMDEATSDDNGLLKILRDQVPKLPGTFRFFVTSRPSKEVDILSLKTHVRTQKIDVLAHNNLTDIEVYAHAQLKEMAIGLDVDNEWPSHHLLHDFARKSEGLFIWAFTVCKYLRNMTRPDKEVDKFLSDRNQSSIPTGLPVEETMDKLYQTILNRCNWADESFVEGYGLYMGAVVAAKIPLSSLALQSLHQTCSSLPVPDVFRPLNSLMNNVDHPNQPIRVAHLSLRDFLTSRAPEQFRLDKKEHSQRLALLCLKVMNRNLNPSMPGLQAMPHWETMPDITDHDISEELWYACRFWTDHITDSGPNVSDELIDELLKLLSVHMVPWMGIVTAKGQFQRFYQVRDWIKERFPRRRDLMCAAFQRGVAYSAYRLAIILSSVGRLGEGLEALQEAVHINRQLAKLPDSYTATSPDPFAAACLNNLASCLHDFGRLEEAVRVSREAIKLHRELATNSHAESLNESLSRLARSLNNHSGYLFNLGSQQEALDVMTEAINIRQELFDKDPMSTDCDIASFLVNHSNHLRRFGRLEEATEVIQRAVDINRRLAADQPGEFEPSLASSLADLSLCLTSLGRKEEALAMVQEAIGLYRRFATDRPEAVDHKCAGWLNNVSVILFNSDHRAEALELVKEVITIQRQLTTECPEAFLPNLAYSLGNLAAFLSKMDRDDESLAAVRESIGILRSLTAYRIDISEHLECLTKSLVLLSRQLSKSGHRTEALEHAQEAVIVWRGHPTLSTLFYRKHLIGLLANLHECLDNLGHEAEAMATMLEVMVLYHGIESPGVAPPSADRADASRETTTLAELIQVLEDCGTLVDSEHERLNGINGINVIRLIAERAGDLHTTTNLQGAIQKLLNIIRQPCLYIPTGWSTPPAANATHGRHHSDKPQASTSHSSQSKSIRAISLTDQLAHDLEHTVTLGLCDASALYLTNLSARLFDSGLYQEAVEAVQMAVNINRRRAADNYMAFAPDLASSLNIHFNCLYALDRYEESLAAIQEVVNIHRRLAAERPQAFNRMFEASLQVLAQCLQHFGLEEEALPLVMEMHIAQSDPVALEVDSVAKNAQIVEVIDDIGPSNVSSELAEVMFPIPGSESWHFPSSSVGTPIAVDVGEHSESPDIFLQGCPATRQRSHSPAERTDDADPSIESVGEIPQTPVIDEVITSPTTAAMAMHSKVEVAVQTDVMHPCNEAMMVQGMRPIIAWSINRSGATRREHSTWQIELPGSIRREDFLILLWGPPAMYMVYQCLMAYISSTFPASVHR